jgi:hypothetical protein
MRYLRLPLDIMIAMLFAASIGIAMATVASALTHRLEAGLRAGIVGLLLAAACFGYHLWRTYRRPKPDAEHSVAH